MREEESIADAIARHGAGALLFSGGRDSLALLELSRPFLSDLVVLWVNTGAAHPETIRQMGIVRRLVPHFLEVNSDVQAGITAHGHPVDVVPLRCTSLGRSLEADSQPKVKLQSFMDCCAAHLWYPAWNAVKEMGFTLILRGERAADARKGPVKTGMVTDGIEILQPIFEWSDDQVVAFLDTANIQLPAVYDFGNKGLDCWCCTAFWEDAPGHLRYLKAQQPDLYDEMTQRLREVRAAIDSEVSVLHNLLEGL